MHTECLAGFAPWIRKVSRMRPVCRRSAPVYSCPEVTAAECVEMALDVGYRFLDCAEFYGNEAEVGKARCRSSRRLTLTLTLTLTP